MLAHVFIITPRRPKSRGFLKKFSVKCNKVAGSLFSGQKTCNGPRNVLFYKKGAPPGGAHKKGPRFRHGPQRVAKATRFRGNPFLRVAARQKSSWLRCPVFTARAEARLQKADRCPCFASAVSSAGRASALQSLISPWGQNLAPNRALGLAASHTPGAKFPCMCPVHPHMSAGQDFSTI